MSVSCTICQEDINFCDEETSVLHCGHLFHELCLQQWLSTRMTCPQCRTKLTRGNFVRKIYLSANEDADIVYRGSSDETKTILNTLNENNTNIQKMFIKRITYLEEQNKDFASKNSKLEENLKTTLATMRSLQKENKEKDEKLDKLRKENEKLKAENKVLKENNKNQFEELKSLNEKHKLSLKELQKENYELKIDHNKLKEESNKLKESLKTKTKELKILKLQKVSLSDLENENKELKNKLSLVTEILVPKDKSSISNKNRPKSWSSGKNDKRLFSNKFQTDLSSQVLESSQTSSKQPAPKTSENLKNKSLTRNLSPVVSETLNNSKSPNISSETHQGEKPKLKNGPFQVFVKCPEGKTITVDVDPSCTVSAFKHLVKEKTGIPIKGQRFVYGVKQLENDDMLLSNYNVQKESTIFSAFEISRLEPNK